MTEILIVTLVVMTEILIATAGGDDRNIDCHFVGDDRNIDSHFGEYNPPTSSVATPAICTDSTILMSCLG